MLAARLTEDPSVRVLLLEQHNLPGGFATSFVRGRFEFEAALHELDFDGRGFEWVDCHSREQSVLAYLRKARNPEDMLAICMNMTPVPLTMHRLCALWDSLSRL